MGFFSWLTADTGESISNRHSDRGALPVYFLVPKEYSGISIFEDNYDGYGIFGGIDALNELGRWNLKQYLLQESKIRIKDLLDIEINGMQTNRYSEQEVENIIDNLMKDNNDYLSKCRSLGISIDCEEININFKFPLKIVESPDLIYETCHGSCENCREQGYFYNDSYDDDDE